MDDLMERKPWLYTKSGDEFSFEGKKYTVRLNHLNDIYFVVDETGDNLIFFSDKGLVIADSDIVRNYKKLADNLSS